MKYCVQADLRFETPAKNDQMSQTVKDKLVGKLTWGLVNVSQGLSDDGKPSTGVTVRFDKEADMNELYALIKDRMVQLPVLKGRVSKHLCFHDKENRPPCVIQEEYVK